MTKKFTSFGVLEVISENPKVERMTFDEEGSPHKHDVEEYCYVLSGSGKVMGADKECVEEGDFCRIPSGTYHYMIPYKKPFNLLIFYEERE